MALFARARPFRGTGKPCFWQETLSVTARSPWNLSQLTLEARPGSSRAWPGSAFCSRVFAEGKACVSSCSSRAFCFWPLVRASEDGFFFCNFSFSLLGLDRSTDVLSCQHVSWKKCEVCVCFCVCGRCLLVESGCEVRCALRTARCSQTH